MIETHFKGWAKPGPIPPGAESGESPGPDESLDAISGHFRLYQLKQGHRFSTDDILAAWYGTSWCPSAARVLDLGSGIGTVGMIAAWRLPNASFVTVEAQEQSVELGPVALPGTMGWKADTRFARETSVIPASSIPLSDLT